MLHKLTLFIPAKAAVDGRGPNETGATFSPATWQMRYIGEPDTPKNIAEANF